VTYIEIFCVSCRKPLGRYNTKFYSEDKIGGLLKTAHSVHMRDGHTINVRRV